MSVRAAVGGRRRAAEGRGAVAVVDERQALRQRAAFAGDGIGEAGRRDGERCARADREGRRAGAGDRRRLVDRQRKGLVRRRANAVVGAKRQAVGAQLKGGQYLAIPVGRFRGQAASLDLSTDKRRDLCGGANILGKSHRAAYLVSRSGR